MKQPVHAMMTVKEVASYLRFHSTTIYRLLKDKQIPAFKVATEWRFERKEIDQWMRDKGAWKQ